MQDLNDKITGGTLTAVEWNQVPSELQNVIEALGIVLSSGDLNQLGKAIAAYSADGDFYTDGGAADAYVLTQIGSKQAPPAYADGMRVRCNAANANTGASTVNVAGLGVKDVRQTDGGVLLAGMIKAGVEIELAYDVAGGYFVFTNRNPVGVGQTIQDTSGGRALTTIYTNTTKRPIFVSISLHGTTSAGAVTLLIDSVVYDTESTGGTGVSFPVTVTGPIPPGSTYQVTTSLGTPSALDWKEIR